MNNAQQLVASVLHADRQYIQAAQDRIAELERENSKLRARLAFTEKLYAQIVPENPVAWIDREHFDTTQDVYHTAVVRFLELNVDAFDELLATMHKAYVESENTEAKIAAKGEF
jgi:Mg2+ and Co2+ transporter CorA